MAKFALLLFVIALCLFMYCEFHASMGSAPNLYWSVDGARTEIQKLTPKMPRKLLQSDDEEECEGGEWCEEDEDCDGDCTCDEFFKENGDRLWECEPPSDDEY